MRNNSETLSLLKVSTVRDNILREGLKEKEYSKNKVQDQFGLNKPTRKQYIGKRFFDVILGVFGLQVYLLLYPVIALGIKFSSEGSIIYKQKRTGMNGHSFTCYKFRTMQNISKKSKSGEPDITLKGDSRIFWFGKILRKTNLDELPQIINVIKGEMSFIGPRPYPVNECQHWNNTFEDFFYRYMVKPGVTGYAQVTGYRGGTLDVEHMRKRLDKDLIYVEKQSFWMDIKIVFLTIKQMLLFKTNAH